MDTRCLYSRILIVAGLVLLLLGVPDPLEGAVLMLPGIGLIAIGALIATSRYADMLCWAVVLVWLGIGALVILTWIGGVGGNSGLSKWGLMVLWPYPIGWVMGLVGGIRALVETWSYRASHPRGSR